MKRYQNLLPSLERVISDVEALQRDLQTAIARVNQDERLTADAKAAEVAKLREAAIEQFRTLRTKGDELAAGVLEGVDQAAIVTPDNRTEAMLAQQSGWARVERMLGQAPIETIIADAAASGDVDALRAIRAEFPSYLRSRNLKAFRTLEAVDRSPVVREQLAMVERELDTVEAPYLRAQGHEEAADAMEARPKVRQTAGAWRATRDTLGAAVTRGEEPRGVDRLSLYYATHEPPVVMDGRLSSTEGATDE